MYADGFIDLCAKWVSYFSPLEGAPIVEQSSDENDSSKEKNFYFEKDSASQSESLETFILWEVH